MHAISNTYRDVLLLQNARVTNEAKSCNLRDSYVIAHCV